MKSAEPVSKQDLLAKQIVAFVAVILAAAVLIALGRYAPWIPHALVNMAVVLGWGYASYRAGRATYREFKVLGDAHAKVLGTIMALGVAIAILPAIKSSLAMFGDTPD